jgi:SAM-dependent methyltransferase
VTPDAAAEDLAEVDSYYERILPFYELETLGRRDLAFWKALVRRFRPASVLEIGAGLGRVSAELAPIADLVVGLEPSIAMLLRARRRLSRQAVRLVAGDMRCLPLSKPFDLIVAPGDPFCHVTSPEERVAALADIARHLTPGGHFVLEGLRLAPDGPRRRRRRVHTGSQDLIVDETWQSLRDGLWRATFRYELGDRAGESSFVARPWSAESVETLFASAGLAIQEMWGDFSGAPFAPDSPRRIVLARRRGTTTARASAAEASPLRRAAARAGRSRAARRADTSRASRAC